MGAYHPTWAVYLHLFLANIIYNAYLLFKLDLCGKTLRLFNLIFLVPIEKYWNHLISKSILILKRPLAIYIFIISWIEHQLSGLGPIFRYDYFCAHILARHHVDAYGAMYHEFEFSFDNINHDLYCVCRPTLNIDLFRSAAAVWGSEHDSAD